MVRIWGSAVLAGSLLGVLETVTGSPASEFDRRAWREPSDGFFEDELVSLGTAGGGLEGLGPVAVQDESCVRCGCRQDPSSPISLRSAPQTAYGWINCLLGR